jgi:hypothetical protein
LLAIFHTLKSQSYIICSSFEQTWHFWLRFFLSRIIFVKFFKTFEKSSLLDVGCNFKS